MLLKSTRMQCVVSSSIPAKKCMFISNEGITIRDNSRSYVAYKSPREPSPEGCGNRTAEGILARAWSDTWSSTCFLHFSLLHQASAHSKYQITDIYWSNVIRSPDQGLFLPPAVVSWQRREIFFALFHGTQPSVVPQRDARSFRQRDVCLGQRWRWIRGR